MFIYKIEIGKFFRMTGKPDVLQRIPAKLTDSRSYPGPVAVNTATGGFEFFGELVKVEPAERPEHPRREMIETEVVKLVERKYEFGIGSLSQGEDPYYAQSQYQPTGETRPQLVGKGYPQSYGQLWQDCELSNCDNEPVCANCFRCEERHCHCDRG